MFASGKSEKDFLCNRVVSETSVVSYDIVSFQCLQKNRGVLSGRRR